MKYALRMVRLVISAGVLRALWASDLGPVPHPVGAILIGAAVYGFFTWAGFGDPYKPGMDPDK